MQLDGPNLNLRPHLCCGVVRAADQQRRAPLQRTAAVHKVVVLRHLLHLHSGFRRVGQRRKGHATTYGVVAYRNRVLETAGKHRHCRQYLRLLHLESTQWILETHESSHHASKCHVTCQRST